MARSGGELAKRVGVAAVGIPVVVGFAYAGGYWMAGLLGVLAARAAWELGAIFRNLGISTPQATGSLVALLYVLMAVSMSGEDYIVWVVVLALALAAFVTLSAPSDSQPGLATIISVFAAAYSGCLLAFAVWLRDLDPASGWRGAAILFLPIAVTWLGDTAAYSAGRAMGRHKLAPKISPAKTWEGAAAGFIGAAVGSWLYVGLTQSIVGWTLTVPQALGFGAAIAIAGQLGDLVESRFKRDGGVKDSSALLPGHGGILDRLDSLLFVFPVAFAYLRWVGV